MRQNIFLILIILILFQGKEELFCQSRIPINKESGMLEIPENYEVRKNRKEDFFISIYRAKQKRSRIYTQEGYPNKVRVEIKYDRLFLYYLFLNEQNEMYPMYRRGNLSIKRNLKNGEMVQMTMLFRDNKGCYIRFLPYGQRSSMDIYVMQARVYHNIILPVPFLSLIFESFDSIKMLTDDIVDWDSLLYKGDKENRRNAEHIINEIMRALPFLQDKEDGAQDSNGLFVNIKDKSPQMTTKGFNCSGFVKWIIDGFYYPLTGKLISVEVLKRKQLNLRGNRWSFRYEEERDPFFGLDWSRNLAISLYEERFKKKVLNPEKFDVRYVPFLNYIEDVGFTVSDLELVLFLLAQQNPEYFYIGSVNGEFGEDPILRQHFHLVALFPYFTQDGRFRVTILERNKEIDLPSFKKLYEKRFIHLVKIKNRGDFYLSKLE